MSPSKRYVVSRRVLLGGAAAAGTGAVLTAAGSTPADGAVGRCRIDQEVIDAVAAQQDRRLIALRRQIHRHPEAAGQERRTAAVVADRLRECGLSVRTGVGGHGVVGVLHGSYPGRTVAYRSDMDAVPPSDQIDGGSRVAHLCGHDLHTAIGVGIAQVLARLRRRLAGTVVFIFQPAEEMLEGARAMLDDGVLERTGPEEIHALHCGALPVGQFAVTPGSGLPGLDRPVVVLAGPDAADRADRLAADIRRLNTVSYALTSEGLAQLISDVQVPDGPLAEFVWMQSWVNEPDADGRVEVGASYRCWPEERFHEVRDQIGTMAESYDPDQVRFPAEPFPAMVCPEPEGRAVERRLRAVFGSDAATVQHAALPFSSDDFALFLDRLPGTYTGLGVCSPGTDITTSFPHLGDFDPDERAIGFGVRAMAGWLAERTLRSR